MIKISETGICPICETESSFVAERADDISERYIGGWLRGALRCTRCNSAPRERALAIALNKIAPRWRELAIHETSPSGPFSAKLRRECASFTATQYDTTRPLGEIPPNSDWRNENLEEQTFADESFDIVLAQDVFEHLFHPGKAAREIARTLRPGGFCLLTVPVVNPWGETKQRAVRQDNTVMHLLPEQYHGNPVGDGRSLVTIDWSYEIGPYLSRHSGLSFAMLLIDDMRIGVRDPYNVVLVGRKGTAVDLHEPDPPLDAGAHIHFDPITAARALFTAQRPQTALALLNQIDSSQPAWLEGRRVSAQALLTAGRTNEARAVATEAHESRPTALWPLRFLARLDAVEGNKKAEATRLSRLHELLPYDKTIASDFAAVARAIGDTENAERAEATQADWARFDITVFPSWSDSGPTELAPPAATLYLDLIERVLTNVIYRDSSYSEGKYAPFSGDRRRRGRDIPTNAHTMIGEMRLRHLRRSVETLLQEDVPGDLIETGVWRGGACILMRAVLEACGDKKRRVFAADSFAGLPPPDSRFPQDKLGTFDFHLRPELSVSLEAVQENFTRYGLLDSRVVFLKGFFRDSLPTLNQESFSLIRLDGDLYSSTTDALENLYDLVSPGGFIIVDDYGTVFDARRAVRDFREKRKIEEPMFSVDGDAVYWRKPM